MLGLFGQTINIMTLSGLALAGILVDQATVTMKTYTSTWKWENQNGFAIYDACEEISFPLLDIALYTGGARFIIYDERRA